MSNRKRGAGAARSARIPRIRGYMRLRVIAAIGTIFIFRAEVASLLVWLALKPSGRRAQ